MVRSRNSYTLKKCNTGVYLIGGLTKKATWKLRDDIGERATEQLEFGTGRRVFPVIHPKYCRMLNIDPEQMIAFVRYENRIADEARLIKKALNKLSNSLSIAERIWKAHVIAIGRPSDQVWKLIARRFLGISVPRWRIGEYPPSLSVIRLLEDPKRQDAMVWLSSGKDGLSRSFGRGRSHADSVKIVEEMLAAGVVNVTLVAAKQDRTGEWAKEFLAELPKAQLKRTKFIAWVRRLKHDRFVVFDHEDLGQQYAYGLFLDVEEAPIHIKPKPMTPERRQNAQMLEKKIITNLLADRSKQEVLTWLKKGISALPHTLGVLNAAESSKLAKKLYDAGAMKVWAVEIQKDEEYQNTSRLVVQLPKEKDKRFKVFKIVNALGRKQGFDPTPDWRQTHVLVML